MIPGWEDPLEEGMATHSSILAWRIPMDGGDWGGSERAGLSNSAQHRPTERITHKWYSGALFWTIWARAFPKTSLGLLTQSQGLKGDSWAIPAKEL